MLLFVFFSNELFEVVFSDVSLIPLQVTCKKLFQSGWKYKEERGRKTFGEEGRDMCVPPIRQ